MSSLRLVSTYTATKDEDWRMTIIGHAYRFLELYYLGSEDIKRYASALTLQALEKELHAVDRSLPWEAVKDRKVILLNRFLSSRGLCPISGRLFQSIPVYLVRAMKDGPGFLDSEKGPVFGQELRFFSHNSRVLDTAVYSLDPDHPALRMKILTPELKEWEAHITTSEIGSLSEGVLEDLSTKLRNVKFSRAGKRWKANLTFSL